MRHHITVNLLDTLTGFRGNKREWFDGEWYEFPYSEGNFSCDCNRSIWLYGFEPCVDEFECNQFYRNRIIIESIIEDKTGEVLYSEIDENSWLI